MSPAIPFNGLREWTAEAWVKDWRGAVLCRPGEGATVRDAPSHGRHALIRGAEWIFVTDAPGPGSGRVSFLR